jgi:hypothetical protein
LLGHLITTVTLVSGSLGRCSTMPPTCTSCTPQRPWERAPWKHGRVPFFIPESCGPQRTTGHVAVLEPSLAGRRSLKPWDMRQHWSPTLRGCRVQCRRTRGSSRALPYGEVGNRAVGHLAAPVPSSTWRQGAVPWDAWLRRSPPRQGTV